MKPHVMRWLKHWREKGPRYFNDDATQSNTAPSDFIRNYLTGAAGEAALIREVYRVLPEGELLATRTLELAELYREPERTTPLPAREVEAAFGEYLDRAARLAGGPRLRPTVRLIPSADLDEARREELDELGSVGEEYDRDQVAGALTDRLEGEALDAFYLLEDPLFNLTYSYAGAWYVLSALAEAKDQALANPWEPLFRLLVGGCEWWFNESEAAIACPGGVP